MKMIEETENKRKNFGNLHFEIDKRTYDKVGAVGEILRIKEEPLCIFNLDILIEQLKNAKKQLEIDEGDTDENDFLIDEEFYVQIWEDSPLLISRMDDDAKAMIGSRGYVVAPVMPPARMDRKALKPILEYIRVEKSAEKSNELPPKYDENIRLKMMKERQSTLQGVKEDDSSE